jgi:cell division protease FtsH
MVDFEEAKDKVMMGAERKSMVMTEEDKKLAAYHEAGHAIVAKLLPGAQPIHKATIIPRGQTMGMVSFLADERHSVSETRLRTHLATALGGCCAETLIFKERSTGAQGDYKQVTSLARSMVCEWGMSKRLGPLSFGNEDDEVFLGKEFARTRNFSERTAQAIDQEIIDLVLTAEKKAADLLENNQDKLHALAQALLQFEMLDDAEIDRILAAPPLEGEGGEQSATQGSSAKAEIKEAPATGEEGK